PLVGAIIFVGIQDYVSSYFPNNWESFIGALFIVAVIFFPNGILGIVRRRMRGTTPVGPSPKSPESRARAAT
ncbi:MAG: hypothetical protein ACREED_10455, partial [Stellaceae bacterium]